MNKNLVTGFSLSHARYLLNRRRIQFSAMLFAVVLASTSFAQRVDTLRIVHTSDIHIAFDLHQFHPALEAKRLEVMGHVDSLEQFFGSVPRELKAQAVIITGDLIDIYEGETKSRTERSPCIS